MDIELLKNKIYRNNKIKFSNWLTKVTQEEIKELLLIDNNIEKAIYKAVHGEIEKCIVCGINERLYKSSSNINQCCSKNCLSQRNKIPSFKLGYQNRSLKVKGVKRPNHSIKMKEHYASDKGIITKQKLSAISRRNWENDEYKNNHITKLKEAIKSGKFTPCITKSWTHWNIQLKSGKKFRSSFEAIFFLFNMHILHEQVLYEKLRLTYTFENKEHIYIVDFINHNLKFVYEIKPKSLKFNKINLAKLNSLKTWCDKHQYKLFYIDEDIIFQMYNELINVCDEPILEKFYKVYKRSGRIKAPKSI